MSPEDNLDGVLDVRIEDGVIREIGPNLAAGANETLDARGNVVAPGFVDIHVHFREPGAKLRDAGNRTRRGGCRRLYGRLDHAQHQAGHRSAGIGVRRKSRKLDSSGLARIFPVAAVSIGSNGEQLTDFAALKAAGAVAFSDDGRPVKTAGILRRALEMSRDLGVPISEHCEDASLSAGGVMNEGPVAESWKCMGFRTLPRMSARPAGS